MHICFLTNEYPKEGFPHGGLGSFVKTIAQALVEKEIQVTVIGLNYTKHSERVIENGITIIRLKKSKVKGLAWFFNSKNIGKTIAEIHKKNPINIVEGAELSFAFLPKIKGIKYIIRLHGGHHFFAEGENRGINWWKGFQEKRSFKKADAFIAVSNYVKEHTAKYLSYNDKVIEVIFNPINSQLFQPQDIAIEINNITFAGTICEKKGVRDLIQAFPLVKEKFPNVILNLYGRDWFFSDGSSYMRMLQEVELPKISPFDKDVVFHGSIDYDQIPEAYAKAAVCVFPSHMETLGLVAPEAMAMEKAVVFTQLGPGPEVIEDGITGLLCNPHDPIDIACKINRILSDPDFANQLGKKARIAVLNSFESAILVEKNIQFYKNLI
ncbi:glycosyltransferase family 4 protein [Flavobacterium sp.]|jgi:glycosyltransferase involved in cell wall biosynthesis|uniref:glycosyltransferase family 4 protein n=1 Tax=Flavobacterium sp. TaxID=239 RepID=UPI002A804347|nr:glycosyltransferase family 4 protein [Flavobacterium sp.]